jgi:hypothetical protein
MPRIKIISGGQTGVDQAALYAALRNGTECGGCCPEGRLAEDGEISLRYPLTELNSAGYEKRTPQRARLAAGLRLCSDWPLPERSE